jgi:DNA-binding CsgD family transcriptional regulator
MFDENITSKGVIKIMNMRKITSLTALISFVLLMVTSIILYIVPAGRVAYWSDYRLWSLSKEDWGAVHINLGVLLLISILLHVYYNWTPMISYMKNKSKQLRIFTPDFNVSLIVTLVVFFGTLAGIPPMSSIINFGAAISEKANLYYGEPPYGHAELSPLADFADKVKVDLAESMALLEAAGIKVDSASQTMQEIAEANGVSPQHIYTVMKPQSKSVTSEMPEEPPGGTGSRTLAQICEMYQLDQQVIVQGLKLKSITADPQQSMKEIAAANHVDPHTVYAAIYMLAKR